MVQHVAQRSRPRGRLAWFGRGVVAVFLVVALAAGLRSPAQAQSGGAPAVGTAVPFVGTEGGVLAEITVESVEDPFQDYDPSAAPQRAYHFILLTITVENTGNRPFAFDPNAVALQDSEGFLTRPIYLPRSETSMTALPDYPTGEISAGDTSTGALAFQVLNGLGVRNVVYLPASDRLVILADLSGDAGATPTAGDADDADTGAAATPAASTDDDAAGDDADTAAAADLDCDLASAWATGTGERLDAVALLVEELEDFDRETADPVRLAEIADEFEDLADAQAAETAPAELQEASDMFADAFQTFSDLFDDASVAAEDGELDDVADDINSAGADANTVMAEAGELAQTELAACGLS